MRLTPRSSGRADLIMSFTLLAGLLLQASSLVIVRHRVRRAWLSQIGPMFLTMAFLYHGVTELLQLVLPGRNIYRFFVDQDAVDEWTVLVGIAMILCATAYAATVRPPDRTVEASPPDWRIPLALVLPVGILSVSGSAGYFVSGFAGQFLIIGVVLATFGYLRQSGNRRYLLVLLLQCVFLALGGQRLTIVMSVLMLVSLQLRYGTARTPTFTRRRLAAALGVLMLVVVGVSFSRTAMGREVFITGGARDRLSALTSGAATFGGSSAGTSLTEDLAYRFDGNSWPALVHQQMKFRNEPVGWAPLRNNLQLTVPRFLYPQKLELDVTLRVEKLYIARYYEIPPTVDFLPSQLGALYSYGGPLVFFVVSTLLGFAWAAADNRFNRSGTLGVLVCALALTSCVVYYEGDSTIYFLTGRGVAAFLLALGVMRAFRVLGRGAPAAPMPRERVVEPQS